MVQGDCLQDRWLSITIDPITATVSQLKQEICKKTSFSENECNLRLFGTYKPLRDGNKLSDYGIHSDSTIQLDWKFVSDTHTNKNDTGNNTNTNTNVNTLHLYNPNDTFEMYEDSV